MSIMLVDECWGDDSIGKGFANRLLPSLLSAVGINYRDCYRTCVFNHRPHPTGEIKSLFGDRKSGIQPQILKGKYIRKEFEHELTRLYGEISREQPNIIIALGATAAWSLLHATGIREIRGATAVTPAALDSVLGRPFKVLPTYHPTAVVRQWNLRPIVLADFAKASRQSDSPEYTRPNREIWIKPDLADIVAFESLLAASPLSACDIETKQDQITCIGFSPSPDRALVIPFFTDSGENYWKSAAEEVAVWKIIARWLATFPTVFQNGLYDINFLWTRYGIPVPAAAEDTMLLHHALQPEMQKGLGFLASLYTDEASWKFMRKGHKHD